MHRVLKTVRLLPVLLAITCNLTLSARTLYVSSSSGRDSNSGLSAKAPLQSFHSAVSRADTILLKAGDCFYCAAILDGKVISRYGSGPNPCLSGYRILPSGCWKPAGGNIWKTSMISPAIRGYNSGYAKSDKSNNVCCIHECDSDLVHGRKVRHKLELVSDWDFWQTDKIDDSKPSDYDNLYLYYRGNPNELKIEVSVYDTGVSAARSVIDGVNVTGFGFGMSCGSNTVVRNCRIDAIGGRMISEGDRYICYGNGIEFYVSSDISDCIVEDCLISRCYDCGVTIQGQSSGRATPRNIIVRNNLVRNCCQGWEDFLRNDDNVVFVNCRFENNLVMHSGDSGFGYPKDRFKYCHLLGNNTLGNKGMIISGNTFIGGNLYCSGSYGGKYQSNVWTGNHCYIAAGSFLLGNYEGTADVIVVPESTSLISLARRRAVRRYRELTGDRTTRFHYMTREELAERAASAETEFMDTHKY